MYDILYIYTYIYIYIHIHKVFEKTFSRSKNTKLLEKARGEFAARRWTSMLYYTILYYTILYYTITILLLYCYYTIL